ncbi:MAG TPA: HesA/MoeB/ThiF family protein [Syntrophaceae bacterium]|nr:HesA/MoeB/ThiF family protein [Syntrophaceae bacterium]
MNDDMGYELSRYTRQILFSELGESGQKKLLQGRITIVGTGGLGCTSANLLARAGVGYIRLIDHDMLKIHNLHRQILYETKDLRKGIPKVLIATEKLKDINPEIIIEAKVAEINSENVEDLLSSCDLVIDGTDNLKTRFVINEACVRHGIPWIYGACVASCGYMMPIIPRETACLSCLISQEAAHKSFFTAQTSGIIGPVPILIAALQAMAAIKIMTDRMDSLCRDMIFVDLWKNEYSHIKVLRDSKCLICGKRNPPA